jgi:periplasmic divalent cation tolerance protein
MRIANKKEAQKIADKLLAEKLAACVRLTDVNSTFWWKGNRERAEEVMLIIESTEDKFDAVETTARQLHSYETFALTAYQVVQASAGVNEWMEESLS